MGKGQPSTKKLHHFVPQSYLRGFANDQQRITAVELPGNRSFTASVKNVGAQTHFYRMEELEQPDSFEDVLAEVEGKARTAIHVLEQLGTLTGEQRADLGLFIALQVGRGPDTRRTAEAVQAIFVRLDVGAGGRANVGKWVQRNLGFTPTPEQEERIWREATQAGGPPISLRTISHVRSMLTLAQEILPYVLGRLWTFFHFERRSLITSDSPVSLIEDPDAESPFGVGFATAWGVVFPLTRRLAVLMNDPVPHFEDDQSEEEIRYWREKALRGELDKHQRGNTAWAREFNEGTAANARQWIYHHPDDAGSVPSELHEPNLINMQVSGGLADREWDGRPLYDADESEDFSTEETTREDPS